MVRQKHFTSRKMLDNILHDVVVTRHSRLPTGTGPSARPFVWQANDNFGRFEHRTDDLAVGTEWVSFQNGRTGVNFMAQRHLPISHLTIASHIILMYWDHTYSTRGLAWIQGVWQCEEDVLELRSVRDTEKENMLRTEVVFARQEEWSGNRRTCLENRKE